MIQYPDLADREIAGIIAASLAVGRADAIVQAGRWILNRMGSPQRFLANATHDQLSAVAEGFRYRFFDAPQLQGLLQGIQAVLRIHGSLERCAASALASENPPDESLASVSVALVAVGGLVDAIREGADGLLDGSIVLSHPRNRSACKRMMLFLRWMVRQDAVDPGGWTVLSPSDLVIPVDTHMLRIARAMNLTNRQSGSLATALEITRGFARFSPSDPTRYDFALTRTGIHPDIRLETKDIADYLPHSPGYGLH